MNVNSKFLLEQSSIYDGCLYRVIVYTAKQIIKNVHWFCQHRSQRGVIARVWIVWCIVESGILVSVDWYLPVFRKGFQFLTANSTRSEKTKSNQVFLRIRMEKNSVERWLVVSCNMALHRYYRYHNFCC